MVGETLPKRSRKMSAFSNGELMILFLIRIAEPSIGLLPLPSIALVNDHNFDWLETGSRLEETSIQAFCLARINCDEIKVVFQFP